MLVACAKKDLMSTKRNKMCLVVLERGPMLLVASLMDAGLLAVGSDGKPLLVQLDKIDYLSPPVCEMTWLLFCWCWFLLVVPANLPRLKFRFQIPAQLRHLSHVRDIKVLAIR